MHVLIIVPSSNTKDGVSPFILVTTRKGYIHTPKMDQQAQSPPRPPCLVLVSHPYIV